MSGTLPNNGGIDVNQLLQMLQKAQADGADPFGSDGAATSTQPPPPPPPEPPEAPEPEQPAERKKTPKQKTVEEPKPAAQSMLEGREQADEQPKIEEEMPAVEVGDEPLNPIASQVEEQHQVSLSQKMPFFQFKNASEQLEDDNITFDQLRELKSRDFVVLEEAKSVAWTITYGKIVRKVPDSKTNIHTIKREIEGSKDFKEGLKSAKDKSPNCTLTPTVTMKSKGTMMAGYKGLFLTPEDARESDKVICLVPSRDGTLHQLRKAPMGELITPVYDFPEADVVEAGFTPAFPRVPFSIITQVIEFFRHFAQETEYETEALVQVFWDTEALCHVVAVPQQVASKLAVHANLDTDGYPGNDDRFVLCMDIHSHNSMRAFFSEEDDADERDDGVYLVVGRLDRYMPEIKARVCNGGVYVEIPLKTVLDSPGAAFPEEWISSVTQLPPKDGESEVTKGEVFDDGPSESGDFGCWRDGRSCCSTLISSALRALLQEEGAAADY